MIKTQSGFVIIPEHVHLVRVATGLFFGDRPDRVTIFIGPNTLQVDLLKEELELLISKTFFRMETKYDTDYVNLAKICLIWPLNRSIISSWQIAIDFGYHFGNIDKMVFEFGREETKQKEKNMFQNFETGRNKIAEAEQTLNDLQSSLMIYWSSNGNK